MMDDRALAQALLALDAIQVRVDEPFTWSSGIRAPMYCDMRRVMSDVRVREAIVERWVDIVRALRGDAVHAIAGTATAGIAHAAWLAHACALPMVYVRAQPKAHGTQQRIEGVLPPRARVVLVEDLVSTGGSALRAVEALRSAGADVAAVVSIFSYGFVQAHSAFADAAIPFVPLCTLDVLCAATKDEGAEAVLNWRDQINAHARTIV
ncbi:MAG: orotate phosphoribosyltransferase [Paenibacillaceae bacterium]|nr:orotate phosphoribosyltransferase [Paenibacillaceae bacterium]